jgi:PAS domain S-box-containing protein
MAKKSTCEALQQKVRELEGEILEYRREKEALLASEKKYRMMVENAAEGIVVTQYGEAVFVNPRILSFSGYALEELSSRSFIGFIHPDDRGAAIERYSKLITGETIPERNEFRLVDGQGNATWVRGTSVMIEWDGRPAVMTFLANMAEEKAAVEALRKSEETFRLLVDAMNEGLVVQDEKGVLTYVNDRTCEISGYTRDGLIGQPVTGLLDEPQLWIIQEKMRKRKQGERTHYEISLNAKDGRKILTLISPTAIYDPGGRFKGAFAVITDISELKRTTEQLSLLLESLPIVPFTCKAEGDYGITYVSKTIKEITGYSALQFIGNPEFWETHIHPDDRKRTFSHLSVQGKRNRHHFEYRFKVSDGSYR